jgi:hypothetical protein
VSTTLELVLPHLGQQTAVELTDKAGTDKSDERQGDEIKGEPEPHESDSPKEGRGAYPARD